jgi:hypothetical protein
MRENEWKGTTLSLKLSIIPCSVYVRVEVHFKVLSWALDTLQWSGLCTGHFVLEEEHIVYSPIALCAGSGLTPWCMKGVAGYSAVGSREQLFCGRVLPVSVVVVVVIIIIIVVHLMLLLTFAATHCMLLIWITLWFPSDQCCSTVQVFSYHWAALYDCL